MSAVFVAYLSVQTMILGSAALLAACLWTMIALNNLASFAVITALLGVFIGWCAQFFLTLRGKR